MTRLHVRAALSLLFIFLHNVPRSGLVVVAGLSSNYDNPKFYKIGGVLSNDESKSHFEKTIAVREKKFNVTFIIRERLITP